MFPLSCLLSLVPKFFCVLGCRTGTPPVPRRPLSVVYSDELPAAVTVLCLCWTRLVLTVEKMLREVAVWAFQHPHMDLIKVDLLLSSLSWAVTLWSIQVPTPETWEACLTFPHPFHLVRHQSPNWNSLTMSHSNKCILFCSPEHTHVSGTKVL